MLIPRRRPRHLTADQAINQAITLANSCRQPALTSAEQAAIAALPAYHPRAASHGWAYADLLRDTMPLTDAQVAKIALATRQHLIDVTLATPTSMRAMRVAVDSLGACAVAMGDLAGLDHAEEHAL